jgi:hypothetical protein
MAWAVTHAIRAFALHAHAFHGDWNYGDCGQVDYDISIEGLLNDLWGPPKWQEVIVPRLSPRDILLPLILRAICARRH